MRRNQSIGWALLVVSIGMVVFALASAWRRQQFWSAGWLLPVLAIHPGWWMSAHGGDCGYSVIAQSSLLTVVVLIGTYRSATWR
jgi:hypothetical protein